MLILKEIQIGQYQPYNNMVMFRQYDSARGFIPTFKMEGSGVDQYLSTDNKIIVPYLEYFKNANGDVVNELTRFKHFEVRNLPQLIYYEGEIMANGEIALGGEIKREQWNAANDWFMLLARTPISNEQQTNFLNNFTGIIDAIEQTLMNFPLEIPNGYILQP